MTDTGSQWWSNVPEVGIFPDVGECTPNGHLRRTVRIRKGDVGGKAPCIQHLLRDLLTADTEVNHARAVFGKRVGLVQYRRHKTAMSDIPFGHCQLQVVQ